MYRPLKSNAGSPLQSHGAVLEAASSKPDRVIEVKTSYGICKAFIHGDLTIDLPPIITYHDMGVNHVACFQSFFNYAQDSKVLHHFPVIHIDAPGQWYGAPDLAKSIDALDFEELSQGIDLVVAELGLKKVIGFGVGTGASVMLLFAKRRPELCHGLVLVNPTANAAAWTDIPYSYVGAWFGESSFYKRSMNNYFLTRYFAIRKRVPLNILEYFREELNQLNHSNVLRYYQGYLNRKDITEELKKVTTRSIVYIGDHCGNSSESLRVQGKLMLDRTDYIIVKHGGVLLTESNPKKLVTTLDLFFNTMGFFEDRLDKMSEVQKKIASGELEYVNGQLRKPKTTEGA